MKINIYIFLVIVLYSAPKLIFNESGSPLGGFNANTTLIINASVTLLVLAFIAIKKKSKLKIPSNAMFILALIYYVIAFTSTAYSPLPLITSYNSIIGVFFVYTAAAISEYVENIESNKERYQWLLSFILKFSVASILTNALFYFIYFGEKDFFTNGVSADFTAALVLFCSISYYHLNKGFRSCVYLFIAILISFKLNSFSSLMSISVGYCFFCLYNKNYIKLSFIMLTIGFSSVIFYTFLIDHQGSELIINNKPVNAYLTGSGRFDYYLAAVDVLTESSFTKLLFGSGFMAERVLMEGKGLSWVTDPHNSLLLSILGMGIIGVLLYVSFALYPFFKVNMLNPKNNIQPHWIFFHVTFLSYGMTSSYYIGRPTVILIFSLILTFIVTRPRGGQ